MSLSGGKKRGIGSERTASDGNARVHSVNQGDPRPKAVSSSRASSTANSRTSSRVNSQAEFPTTSNRISLGTPLRYDPHFKGPTPNRSCTDVISLVVFILFMVAWGCVALYAFQNGDPDRFLRATDSSGRKCGVDSEVLDEPHLFFFDLTACAEARFLFDGCNTPQVCVRECPTQSWSSMPYIKGQKVFDEDAQNSLICIDDQIKSQTNTVSQLDEAVNNSQCAAWYISSRPLHFRCIPTSEDIDSSKTVLRETGIPNATNLVEKSILQLSIREVVGKVIDDLYNTWETIVVILIITIFVCLFYITLMRWIAGVITWFSIIAILALLTTFAVISYQRYDYLQKNGPDELNSSMVLGQLEELANQEWLFLTLTIGFSVIALILFILIVFLRKSIQMAIALIKEGSKAVGNIISSLFFPIIPWCIQGMILVWFLYIWITLSCVGEQLFKARYMANRDCICTGQYQNLNNTDVCDPKLFSQLCHSSSGGDCKNAGCHFARMESPQIVTFFHVFNVFAIFWAVWFIFGMSDMILAGSFAKWYWNKHKRRVHFFTVTDAAVRTIRYHLGTVAFGALIIALCSFIRACIEYAQKKLKGYKNPALRALFHCLRCFFWCLEKCLRFITKNAYIMCAIHGTNFCRSAKDAFNLLMRNMLRVVVLNKVTDFLLFIGKLVITGGMVVMAHFLFFGYIRHSLNYNSTIPCIVIAIGAYIIASIFFGVYSMAVSTIFLCFLEDCERNDGSAERPYFMSTSLMKILGKRKKKRTKSQ